MILEPNASFKNPIGPVSPGVAIVAEGPDYKMFRVTELLEDSPASEAGLKAGDIVMSVDGRRASELNLTMLHELFEKPSPRKLSVRRGELTLEITVTPRRLI
jgi:C-terminal processing protease CtpA/Prc